MADKTDKIYVAVITPFLLSFSPFIPAEKLRQLLSRHVNFNHGSSPKSWLGRRIHRLSQARAGAAHSNLEIRTSSQNYYD
jgi:hypothetical protein